MSSGFLRAMRRHQRGQVVVLTMFLALPMVLTIAYILNSGATAYRKTEMQNAVDSAVVTEAAWVARSMNVMAMNNTAMTQSFVVANAAYAMDGPLTFAGYESGEVAGYWMGSIAWWAKFGGWPGLIAAVFYTIMYGFFNDQVLNPLYEYYKEVKRAMHTSHNGGGLARSAQAMGQMNRLLVEEGVGEIGKYNRSMIAANGAEGTVTRYSGWDQRSELSLPVVEQSIADALEDLKDLLVSGDASKLAEKSASIRNVLNIRSTGNFGNYESIASLEMDYFSNFDDRGFARGAGPKPATDAVVTSKFTEVHKELELYASGEKIPEFIAETLRSLKGLIPSCGGGMDWLVCDPVIDMLKGILNAVLKPFLDTETIVTDNDMAERLEQVWNWSTLYRDVPYSNLPEFSGRLDILGMSLSAPPRFFFGLPFGFHRGYTKGKSVDTSSTTSATEADLEDLSKKVDARLETEYRACVDRKAAVINAKYEEKRKIGLDGKPLPIGTKRLLTAGEVAARDAELVAAAEECERERARKRKEFEDNLEKDKAVGREKTKDIEKTSDKHKEKDSGIAGATGSDKGGRPKRNYLLWPYEGPYQFGLKFYAPVTEVMDKIEGVPLVSEVFKSWQVELYAVAGPRIVPDDALDVMSKSIFGDFTDKLSTRREDWSIMYLISSEVGVPVLGKGFQPPRGREFSVPRPASTFNVVAQAEVYNTQWFDLYTQNWRAKLTPVSVYGEKKHRDKMKDLFKEHERFTRILSDEKLNDAELRALSTH